MVLEQSYDYTIASEATLKNMGKQLAGLETYGIAKTKHSSANPIYGISCRLYLFGKRICLHFFKIAYSQS